MTHEVEAMEPDGPVSVHVGAFVGAREPAAPAIDPVKVITWPPALLDCTAVTVRVGVA